MIHFHNLTMKSLKIPKGVILF